MRCKKAEAEWLKRQPRRAKSVDSLKLDTKNDVERTELIAEIEDGLVPYHYDRMFPLTEDNQWMYMDEEQLKE